MTQPSDGIEFTRDGVDPNEWPKLSCSQANQLALEVGDLRLDAKREIFLQGNGQLRSFDDMLFLTGDPSLEKLRILANGNIGIGKPDPGAKLEVNGNLKLQQGVAVNEFSNDDNLTDNSDLSVPTEKAVKTYVSAQIAVVNQTLSTKAALAGASSQDFVTKNLTVSGNLTTTGNVGIGTTTTPANLEVNGTVKATAFQGNGATLDGIVKKTGDTMTGALTINNALTVSGNVGIGKPDPGAKLEVNGNLKLQQGVAINKFSSDGNLTDNSDLSVPTEKAVKTYVAAQIAVVNQTLSTKAALAGASSQDFVTKNLTVSGNLTTTGNVGIGTTNPEGGLDINRGTADAQADASSDTLPFTAKADLVLTRRHSATKSLNGYPASLIDFRATNAESTPNEWSVAQILGVVDLNVSGGYAGGLAFLTSPPGSNNPDGRRTRGAAPVARMVIDANGNVGIGTTTPQGFQIILPESNKTLNPTAGVTIAGGKNGNANIELRNNGSGTPYIDFAQSTSPDYDARIRLTDVGKLAIEGSNVGIGTDNPQAKLDVNGSVYVSERLRLWAGDGQYWEIYPESWDKSDKDLFFDFSGNLGNRVSGWLEPMGEGWRNSDERLKEHMEPFGNVLERVMHLHPKSYRWINAGVNSKESFGFIAQEVEKIFPNFVGEKRGYKALNYDNFAVLAIAAIQEQQRLIIELQEEIEHLKEAVKTI